MRRLDSVWPDVVTAIGSGQNSVAYRLVQELLEEWSGEVDRLNTVLRAAGLTENELRTHVADLAEMMGAVSTEEAAARLAGAREACVAVRQFLETFEGKLDAVASGLRHGPQ